MRDTQPPITDEKEYRGYQRARDKMTDLVEMREARLIAALAEGNQKEIEDRRFDLLDALLKQQGSLDALRVYELQRLSA